MTKANLQTTQVLNTELDTNLEKPGHVVLANREVLPVTRAGPLPPERRCRTGLIPTEERNAMSSETRIFMSGRLFVICVQSDLWDGVQVRGHDNRKSVVFNVTLWSHG